MLLVRFSFCEYGSVVCMSPRPAQRSVFASARATRRRARARSAGRASGVGRRADHGLLLREAGSAERRRLRWRDHTAPSGRGSRRRGPRAARSNRRPAAAGRIPHARSRPSRSSRASPTTLLVDARRLRAASSARARRARRPGAWERLADDVERSVAQARRRAARPGRAIAYPARAAGRAARRRNRATRSATHQVVIVCGETGLGQDDAAAEDLHCRPVAAQRGLIGHTQPRRIAARAVATRIAQELGHAARRGGRLQGPLHRPDAARRVRQAHDRRHPARGDAGRPLALRLRHDHRRRGARAQPQHRLPARAT